MAEPVERAVCSAAHTLDVVAEVVVAARQVLFRTRTPRSEHATRGWAWRIGHGEWQRLTAKMASKLQVSCTLRRKAQVLRIHHVSLHFSRAEWRRLTSNECWSTGRQSERDQLPWRRTERTNSDVSKVFRRRAAVLGSKVGAAHVGFDRQANAAPAKEHSAQDQTVLNFTLRVGSGGRGKRTGQRGRGAYAASSSTYG